MALTQSTPLPFPESEKQDGIFQPQQQDLLVEFAEQFTQLQGKFSYCENEQELIHNLSVVIQQHQWKQIFTIEDRWRQLFPAAFLSHDISTCEVSVTGCEALVARTGSMVLSSFQQGRIPSVYAPVHICIATSSQIVYDIKDALFLVQKRYTGNLPSLITFATGPSRTADIEKTLVVGVHGPKEVYCFVLDDQEQ